MWADFGLQDTVICLLEGRMSLRRLRVPRVCQRSITVLGDTVLEITLGEEVNRKAARNEGPVAAVQSAVPPSPEATRKTLRRAKADMTKEKEAVTVNCKVTAGELYVFFSTGEDCIFKEVYRD